MVTWINLLNRVSARFQQSVKVLDKFRENTSLYVLKNVEAKNDSERLILKLLKSSARVNHIPESQQFVYVIKRICLYKGLEQPLYPLMQQWVYIELFINDLPKLFQVVFVGFQVAIIPNVEKSNFDIIKQPYDRRFPMYPASSYFKKSVTCLDSTVFF